MTERVPIRCGARVNPPTFTFIYKLKDKTRSKCMPLRNFKPDSDVKFVAEELRKRHNLNDIPLIKIEKMLRLIQELQNGKDKLEAIDIIEREFTIRLNEDLNKLPVTEIEIQKQLMDSLFTKNQVKKDSNDFVYDKQVDFDGEKEISNWDEDDKKDKF